MISRPNSHLIDRRPTDVLPGVVDLIIEIDDRSRGDRLEGEVSLDLRQQLPQLRFFGNGLSRFLYQTECRRELLLVNKLPHVGDSNISCPTDPCLAVEEPDQSD